MTTTHYHESENAVTTSHADPLKVVSQKIFEFKLESSEKIAEIQGKIRDASTPGHLDTLTADMQLALAHHEMLNQLHQKFVRKLSEHRPLKLVLLAGLRDVDMQLAMVASRNYDDGTRAHARGKSLALRQVADVLYCELYDAINDESK